MSNTDPIQAYYGNFTYDGINVTVDFRDGSYTEIPLTEDMISEVERLKFFKMGSQAIEVVYRERFKTTMDVTVLLNQFKDSYALVGYECVYDGEPHAVTVNQELPEGATISYPYGNIFTNAGSYEVVGVMSKNGYESKTLSTTLTIHQAERKSDDIVFEDATVVYTGEMQRIEAQNVPEGVEVTYDTFDFETGIRVNKVVNAGKYKVVARFNDTSPNYAKIPDMEAILTIEKAYYDVSAIKFEDVVVEYDGTSYEASLVNAQTLPTEAVVTYSYKDEQGNTVTSHAGVGTYTMTATVSNLPLDNYHPIEPFVAKLTVTHRIISIQGKVSFESKTVSFDENTTYSLSVTNLDDRVNVTYENNDQHYAGEYKVIAHFEAKDPNEAVDISEMEAYLVINSVRRSVMSWNEQDQAFSDPFTSNNIHIEDGAASIVGIDFDTFKVTAIHFYNLGDYTEVAASDLVNGTTYSYIIQFEYLDPDMNRSVILSQESDTFTYVGA